MHKEDMVIGCVYKFRSNDKKLEYIGKEGNWHQFVPVGETKVWSELLDEDLWMMEEVK